MHRTMTWSFRALALLAAISLSPGQAKAELILAADFDPATNFNNNPGQPVAFSPGTYGYSFTVGNSALSVSTLATAYAGYQGQVTIYLAGTSTAIATAFVDGSQQDTSQNGNPYNYTNLDTPVTLLANTTYGIVVSTSNFGEAFSPNATGYTTDPDITIVGGLSDTNPADAFPDMDNVGTGIAFGPSFVATSVPEPSSLAMCGIAAAIGLAVARRRRKLAA